MNARRRQTARVMLGAVLLALTAHACGAPSEGERVTIVPPSRDAFPLVGVMLVRHCGTLDCHGKTDRSLRLYGQSGMRLDPLDRPGETETTAAELEADYRSVVGLEPEVLSAIVTEHGASPDRLTLVRKARNTEQHLGGRWFSEGDDADRCFTSWLTGALDDAACTRATAALDPLLDAP